MILSTKEMFVVIKKITALFVTTEIVNVIESTYDNGQNRYRAERVWKVMIKGTVDHGDPHNGDGYVDECIMCETKEDAYRILASLQKQIANSGEIEEFTTEMFEKAVLNKEEQ